MKKLACWPLAFILLAPGCKKDNPVADDPNVMALTFTGIIRDAITQLPVADAAVHVVYGTMCCGGIEVVKGSDSTTTDFQGKYTIHLEYTKGGAAYRHIVYTPGYSAKHVKLPPSLQRNWVWTTLDYDPAAVLPDALADTVKIVKGLVSTVNFKVLPASFVQLHFPYANVPATDSLHISATSSLDDIASPYAENLNQVRQFNPNAAVNSLPYLLELPTLADREIIIRTSVYEAGSGVLKATSVDSVTLVQGQIYNYEVTY